MFGSSRSEQGRSSRHLRLALSGAAVVLVAAAITLGAGCGDEKSAPPGLSVLSPGSPSRGASSGSPSASPSPSASSSSSPSASPLSPSASGMSPSSSTSPQPSPSPSYLDPADELEAYLAAVKPTRMEMHRLSIRLDHVIWKDTSHYIDAGWPRAGRRVYRLARRIEGLRVKWDLITPPDDLKAAHASYQKCMRANQQAYYKIAYCLENKIDWSEDSRYGRKITDFWDKAGNAFDAFKHAVVVQSRTLHVKIPWRW